MLNRTDDFEILERIAVLSCRNAITCELTKTKFGRYEPKFDLRRWKVGPAGEELNAFKGVQLSADELKALRDALNALDLGDGDKAGEKYGRTDKDA